MSLEAAIAQGRSQQLPAPARLVNSGTVSAISAFPTAPAHHQRRQLLILRPVTLVMISARNGIGLPN